MDGFVRHKELDNKLRNDWKSYGFKKIAVGYGCSKSSCDTEVWYKD